MLGEEDKLQWNHLQSLFDVKYVELSERDFPTWNAFAQRHPDIVTASPVELLNTIAERLEQLLGDFYLREEMPFLLAINAEKMDESSLLIYADWLEERGHQQRSDFLRLYARYHFHERDDEARIREELQASFRETSAPWLCQLFGTSALVRNARARLHGEKKPWWKFW